MTGFADVLNVVHLFVAALVSETYGYVDRTKQPICICIYIYKQIVQGEERRCSLTRKISFAAVAILSLCIYGPSQARPLVSWLNLISNSLFPERWSLATCRQRKEKTTRAAIIQALPGSLSWRWSCLRRRHRRRLGKDRVETLPSRHRCSCHPWS